MSKIAITEQLVGRFLSWPLPADFALDCGITFTRSLYAGMSPTGTSLLYFGQAKAMLETASMAALPAPVGRHPTSSACWMKSRKRTFVSPSWMSSCCAMPCSASWTPKSSLACVANSM